MSVNAASELRRIADAVDAPGAGEEMLALVRGLFPLYRSVTGEGLPIRKADRTRRRK